MILQLSSPCLAPADTVSSSGGAAATAALPRDPSPSELAIEFNESPEIFGTPSADTNVSVTTPVTEKKEVTEVKKEEVKSIVEPGVPEDDKKLVIPDIKPEFKKAEVAQKLAAVSELPPKSNLITPISMQPKQRDYTGFSQEETSVLKAMSNEAYEYTSKLIRGQKDLEKLKDASYLQHPQAYTLSPEYQKLQTDAYYYNVEADYWKKQLFEIAEGREWAPIKGWNKDGSIALGPMQKPTAMAAEDIRTAMFNCNNKSQNLSEQVQNFGSKYKQQIDNDSSTINRECAQRFGWVADPKQLDEKISNPAIGEKTVRQVREDYISLFPPYLQNSIATQVGAHLFAALQIQAQQIHELQNGKQIAAIKQEEQKHIEPNSKQTPAPEVNGARGKFGEVKEFTMEGFPV